MALLITWLLGRNASRLKIISKWYKTSWFPLKDWFWTKYTFSIEGSARHCEISEPSFGLSNLLSLGERCLATVRIELQRGWPNRAVPSVLPAHLLLSAIVCAPQSAKWLGIHRLAIILPPWATSGQMRSAGGCCSARISQVASTGYQRQGIFLGRPLCADCWPSTSRWRTNLVNLRAQQKAHLWIRVTKQEFLLFEKKDASNKNYLRFCNTLH